MSLTSGRGPLSAQPFGRFSSPLPDGVSYVEPFRRRVRAMVAGRTVIDSERVLLVHCQGESPAYLFPTDDAGTFGDRPDPIVAAMSDSLGRSGRVVRGRGTGPASPA